MADLMDRLRRAREAQRAGFSEHARLNSTQRMTARIRHRDHLGSASTLNRDIGRTKHWRLS